MKREFRYTSTNSDGENGALSSKTTRASEGQVDPHLQQLKKLEQLAKVYGEDLVLHMLHVMIVMCALLE